MRFCIMCGSAIEEPKGGQLFCDILCRRRMSSKKYRAYLNGRIKDFESIMHDRDGRRRVDFRILSSHQVKWHIAAVHGYSNAFGKRPKRDELVALEVLKERWYS